MVRSFTFPVSNHLLLLLLQVKALGCDGSSSLSSWLENIGLHEYLPNFLASGYRSLDCVKNLWELEIVNVSHGGTPRWRKGGGASGQSEIGFIGSREKTRMKF